MITHGQSINNALDVKLSEDKRVILLGEDICDPYGGAFKITKGLSTKYPICAIETSKATTELTAEYSGFIRIKKSRSRGGYERSNRLYS